MEEVDISDVFSPNAQPVLQSGDHVTLYPGNFQQALEANPITIPDDIYVTILPGALVGYDVIDGPLDDRYENIDGAIENIADLNIADQYTTLVEKQSPRIRRYPADGQGPSAEDVPFFGQQTLGDAARNAEPGDTIIVFPGEYNVDSNLFVSNVKWYFMEGSRVLYDAEFTGGTVYPHALFDDLKANDGTVSIGGKTTEILGKGEFVISPPTEQPTSGFNTQTVSAADWDSWHMYSLLGINDDNTRIDFRASKVILDDFADGAFKISGGEDVNIEVDELIFRDSIQNNTNLPATVRAPSAFIFNGIDGNISSDPGRIKATLDVVSAGGANPPAHLAIGINHDTTIRSSYTGNVELKAPDVRSGGFERLLRFNSDISPERLVFDSIKNKGTEPSLFFEAAGPAVTKLVIKGCVFDASDVNQPPVQFLGNTNQFDPHLSDSWLITGQNVDFSDLGNVSAFSVEDLTDSAGTDWTGNRIKIYGDCFADAPIQNYQGNLDDELNNIIWSSDVSPLR